MIIIFLIIFLIAFIFLFKLRLLVYNLPKVLVNAPVDIVRYFKFKEWRNPKCGKIICITGYFGSGKTLSQVYYAQKFGRRYSGKKVFDFKRMCWVNQRVIYLSNVDFVVPDNCLFVRLKCMSDLTDLAKLYYEEDTKLGTKTLLYVLGDEFGASMNSRNFRSNIDADTLNTLLTCRKYNIILTYCSQRFNLVDKLYRDITLEVWNISKLWRLVEVDIYDGWQLENASDPTSIPCKTKIGYFAENKLFNSYNTLALVDNLEKSLEAGDRLSSEEILNLRLSNPDMEQIKKPSRKYRKYHKK